MHLFIVHFQNYFSLKVGNLFFSGSKYTRSKLSQLFSNKYGILNIGLKPGKNRKLARTETSFPISLKHGVFSEGSSEFLALNVDMSWVIARFTAQLRFSGCVNVSKIKSIQ